MPNQNDTQNERKKIFEELNSQPKPLRLVDLPRRIELCQAALSLVSREAETLLWGRLQDDLANSLMQTPQGSRTENIERAIECFEQALKVKPHLSKEWANTQNGLANAYRDRFLGNRNRNIERAILHYRQALKVRTREADAERWAMTQFGLAGAYHKRVRGIREKNLEQAIFHAQKALEVFTLGKFSHYWAQTLQTLGEVYRVSSRESRSKNIEKAINCFNQALEVHQKQVYPEDWARLQNSLGNAYLFRIDGNRAENIEKAIDYYQQALKVRKQDIDPVHWAMTQYNLGNAYRNRIRGDQAENLEQALYHLQQSLVVRTFEAFPEDHAQSQNNLGNVYLVRMRGNRDDNLELAIQCFLDSLKVRTRARFPADWAETQNNLAIAYTDRAKDGQGKNIELAIQHYQDALQVRTNEEFPEEWAQTLNNLAHAKRMQAAESLEQTIQHLQDALKVRTRQAYPVEWAETQNNLAIAFTERLKGDRDDNLEKAREHYQQALEVYTVQNFPDKCLIAARSLGNLAFEEQRWRLASNAYAKAFGAQDILLQASFSRAGKQAELSEARNLPPRAAYAHIKTGDVKQAVEVLEHGRAQLLRESLERRRLEKLPGLDCGHLYRAYKQAMDEYMDLQGKGASPETRSEDWLSRMDRALEKVQTATVLIREDAGQKNPEYQFFLQALPFDKIQEQAVEKPLVYLSATSAGGMALVVRGQTVKALELPELNQRNLQKKIWHPSDEEIDRINANLKQGKITSEDVQAVKGGYFSTYALWSLAPYLTNTPQEVKYELYAAWYTTLDETTRWLWNAVMGDLLAELKKDSHSVTLIPAGQLALLPLHAAWIEDVSRPTGRLYALDEMNICYAPSAHALWQASLAADRQADELMAVDNPDGTLVYSEDEVQAALDVFSTATHLPGKQATIDMVKKEMQDRQVLHFSTHGNAGWQEAEQARLKLFDGYLTLPDIFALELKKARLAVLSACETGVPGMELIDEMIGLPAGMLQAGVPGVIGSLWSVDDMSTAMLMARFYKLWRKDGNTPQEALRQAQIWVRDKLIRFKSPYYWAAFTYTGF